MVSPMRILIVDDHLGFLETAAQLLETFSGVQVVGRALSGRDAVAQAAQLQPDLVFVDLIMPELDGLWTTRYLKAQPHPPQVIILTVFAASVYRDAALAAGADGFLAKEDFGAQVTSLFSSSPALL